MRQRRTFQRQLKISGDLGRSHALVGADVNTQAKYSLLLSLFPVPVKNFPDNVAPIPCSLA
jgi:hypothetical protein